MVNNKLYGWGKFPSVGAKIKKSIPELTKLPPYIIPRGNGRSYGDVALAPNVIDSLANNLVVELNEKDQTITCKAGVLISDLTPLLASKGYKLFVTPGTAKITIGGAIANDVHGKNQANYGSFGNHITSFLLKTDKGTIVCSREENSQLFYATIGGVGLTGLIIEATIRLRKEASQTMEVIVRKFDSISPLFDVFESDKNEFKAAWITGFGHVLYTSGKYTSKEIKTAQKSRKVPGHFFGAITSSLFLNTIEKLLYRKAKVGTEFQHESEILYPLDKFENWNNLYPNGFIQVQFVIEKPQIKQAINATEAFIKKHNLTSFLRTLKRFDDLAPSEGWLSFVKKGYAYSVDIKYHQNLEKKLETLADTICDLGGRFYLAKDAFMNETHMKKSYDKFEDYKVFLKENKPTSFGSLFSNRVNLHENQSLKNSATKQKNSPLKTLILGANSDIAKALAIELKGHSLILASRNTSVLQNFVTSNSLAAEVVFFDAKQNSEEIFNKYSNIDLVVSCFGYLGNQEIAESDNNEAQKIISTNFIDHVTILDLFAQHFENNKQGTIVGISSVAADRGRASNYYYGSAKAGFDAYLSGLRNRLFSSNVHVLTVKPGFVKTKMIDGIETPSFLTSSSEKAAKQIHRAIKKKRNIIYVGKRWFWVMLIIKNIPEFIFKRTSL